MAQRKTRRDQDVSKREAIKEELIKRFKKVERAFSDHQTRTKAIRDNWESYHCKLGSLQNYHGDYQVYVPIIRNAVEALKTRYVNQLFPKSGRYVDAVTDQIGQPNDLIALMELYVQSAKLRTEVVAPLLVCGQVEGQYSVYVRWDETERHVCWAEKDPELPGSQEVIVEADMKFGMPDVEVISDSDLIVLPVTARSIDAALASGGSVTVLRRWTEDDLDAKAEDGLILQSSADTMKHAMSDARVTSQQGIINMPKEMADAAGIKAKGKFALVFEMFTRVKVDGQMRLVQAFYGGRNLILGAKLNPTWSDRCPVLSVPVKKVPGRFKGLAPVDACIPFQVAANDAINQGLDGLNYSLSPVTLVDPNKVTNYLHLVMGPGAVWPVGTDGAKTIQFPILTPQVLQVVEAAKQEIFQTLGVSPGMMPQQTGANRKRNQAEIALEQQVDLLTTAEEVKILEDDILTPLMQRFSELDHQYRKEPMMVRMYGDLGVGSRLQSLDPVQSGHLYQLRWFGVESARNAAQIQQLIASINVMKSVPPAMYKGYQLDLTAIMEYLVSQIAGPRLAPKTFRPAPMQQGQDGQQRPGTGLGGAAGGPGPTPGSMPQGPRMIRGMPGSIHRDHMPAAGAAVMPRKM